MIRSSTAMRVAGLAAAAALAGCEAPGFVAQGVAGDTVPPRHRLRERVTMVMVDDPANELGSRGLARRAAAQARYQLEKRAVVPELVPAERLDAVRAALGPDYERTAIDRIGRRCGAEQVIYVRVTEMALERAGRLLHARARGRVKVIDVTAAERVFPDPGRHRRGAPVTAEVPRTRVEGETERRRLLRRLAKRLGTRAAELFYRHPRNPVGDGV